MFNLKSLFQHSRFLFQHSRFVVAKQKTIGETERILDVTNWGSVIIRKTRYEEITFEVPEVSFFTAVESSRNRVALSWEGKNRVYKFKTGEERGMQLVRKKINLKKLFLIFVKLLNFEPNLFFLYQRCEKKSFTYNWCPSSVFITFPGSSNRYVGYFGEKIIYKNLSENKIHRVCTILN